MGGFDRWFNKSQRAQRIFQKSAGVAGKILNKVHDVGGQILGEVNKYAPELSMTPVFAGAQLAVAASGIAGKAATGLSTARSIQDVGKSLGDAYREGKAVASAPPAPGSETLATAADSM